MGEYLHLLKPTAQEFICECVREYGERPDMHRGLLPFLLATDAYRAVMTAALMRQSAIPMTPEPPSKFVLKVLDILKDGTEQPSDPSIQSAVMTLTTKKLQQFFHKHREMYVFDAKKYGITRNSATVELTRINYNQWRVNAPLNYINAITTWLAEKFR